MEIFKIKGIVLKKREINEANLLLTIYSGDLGKISAIAYGIRKSKKRNAIAYNPLSLAEFNIQKRKEYYTVIDADFIKNFKNITKDIEKLEISLYILSSIDKIYETSDEENEFFHKLIEILEFIENIENFGKGYKYYIILSFLRRIMLEHGIYDADELQINIGPDLKNKYNKLLSEIKTFGNNFSGSDISEILDNHVTILKKITKIFENYINEHLQVKIEMNKFMMEEF